MSEEIWKEVPSYPEILASSMGRVMRLPHSKKARHGVERLYVTKPTYGHISKNKNYKVRRVRYYGLGRFIVSRLVCEAFNGTPSIGLKLSVALHLDDNPLNNRPENLKWGTQKENMRAKYAEI